MRNRNGPEAASRGANIRLLFALGRCQIVICYGFGPAPAVGSMDKEQRELATAILDRIDRTAKAAERMAAAVERLLVMQNVAQGTLDAILKALEKRR